MPTIRIDGIATVWLQKRGLPTKRAVDALEYKAKVEAYILANPDDWPYYNREGKANPFLTREHIEATKPLETPATPVQIVSPIEQRNGEKVLYVIVRTTPLGFREYLKTYAYPAQKEEDKWSSDAAWADRFLEPNGARLLAKRILGHSKFKVEPL